MPNDPVIAAVARLRMDLETARTVLARASQRLRDLEDQDLSREQLSAFIGDHGVNSLVAEVNALGQAIAGKPHDHPADAVSAGFAPGWPGTGSG